MFYSCLVIYAIYVFFDGLWYDIIPNNHINYNDFSIAGMKKAGIDTSDEKVSSGSFHLL